MLAAVAFFEEGANAAGAPERNHISLRHHEHHVRKIGKQARRLVHAAGAIDHHVAVVTHEQIEQAGQFRGRRGGGVGLLRAGQQVQAILGRGHQALKQGSIHAVQILQRVHHTEGGARIEMQCSMTDRREVHQDGLAVMLLQRNGGVDGEGGRAASAFGIDDGKNACLAGAAALAARGREAGECFQQAFGSGMRSMNSPAPARIAPTIAIGLRMSPIAKMAMSLVVARMSSMVRMARWRIFGIHIDQHNFGALRLHLAHDGVGRAQRKADIAENDAGNVRALQAVLEYCRLFPVLGQEGDCDAMHGLVLAKISSAFAWYWGTNLRAK